jgi:hypothetical protein
VILHASRQRLEAKKPDNHNGRDVEPPLIAEAPVHGEQGLDRKQAGQKCQIGAEIEGGLAKIGRDVGHGSEWVERYADCERDQKRRVETLRPASDE